MNFTIYHTSILLDLFDDACSLGRVNPKTQFQASSPNDIVSGKADGAFKTLIDIEKTAVLKSSNDHFNWTRTERFEEFLFRFSQCGFCTFLLGYVVRHSPNDWLTNPISAERIVEFPEPNLPALGEDIQDALRETISLDLIEIDIAVWSGFRCDKVAQRLVQ